MDRISNGLLAAAIFLAPFASVGLLQVLTGHSAGTGLQPAFVPLLALIPCELFRRRALRTLEPDEQWVLIALCWMAIASVLTWSLSDMGLAGEQPWSKSAKQFLLWSFLVSAALAAARVFQRSDSRWPELALSLGLLVTTLLAMVAPGANLPWLDTNGSIASGSDELYLGHAFTGLSRLRGPMPEPLMLGSYLLAAVPLVAGAALARSGFARAWRLAAAVLGVICLVGTWSRGAWLAAVVAVLLFGFLWARGRFGRVPVRRVIAVAAIACVLGLLGFSVLLGVSPWEVPTLLVRRVAQSMAGHDMSNMTRVWSWSVAWELFRESPVYGHGWGSYGFLFFERASAVASGAHFGWPVTNNLALLLLAETGAIGLALWTVVLWPALRVVAAPDSSARSLLLAVACVGLLVQLGTFSQWNLPHIFLVFSAAIAAARNSGRGVAGAVGVGAD